MSEKEIALMELFMVGGLGILLILSGILVRYFSNKGNQKCTAMTYGNVVGYGYRGEGRIFPVVEFLAMGKIFSARKKFNGIITVKKTWDLHPKLWEDEKGYLHVSGGVVMPMKQLAEETWPIGSQMRVFYNPDNPKKNYVERPTVEKVYTIISISMGFFTVAMGVLVYYLIQL